MNAAANLLIVLTLALGLRLTYLNLVRNGPLSNPDSEAYQSLAQAMKDDQPYSTLDKSRPGGFPADLQRPPGYPAFIWLVNPQPRINRIQTAIIQVIMGALLAVLIAFFVGKVADPLTGVFAGLFYAFDWATIIHTPLLIAETLYAVILTLAVIVFALYLRQSRMILVVIAGGILGVAALIKPAAQLLIIPWMLAWAVQPKRSWTGLVFLLAYAVVVVPWMVRNHQRHGLFTLSAVDTTAVYFYTAHGAVEDRLWLDTSTDSIEGRVYRLNAIWEAQTFSPPDRKERMKKEACDLILRHWPVAIKQAVIGFVRTCVGTGRETIADSLPSRRHPGYLVGTILPLAQILSLWFLALIGGIAALRRALLPRAMLVLFAMTALFALLPSAGPMANSRFRTHAAPLLCMLAALGASQAFLLLKNRLYG